MSSKDVIGDNERLRVTALIILVLLILLALSGIFQGPLLSLFGVPSQSTASVATPTTGNNQRAEATQTASIQSTAASATQTAAAKEQPLTVPFNQKDPARTTQAYSGTVTITVSGTGQAINKRFSDAFYLYTDN